MAAGHGVVAMAIRPRFSKNRVVPEAPAANNPLNPYSGPVPMNTPEPRPYTLVAEAIRYLDRHQPQQPALVDIARHVGLSEFHLQRLFTDWAGVSPKQYLQFLTKENAKQRLRRESVLDAALSSGLSGSGRLHDLLLQCEGMTPGEYRQGGRGLHIRYGAAESPFGGCLLAETGRGVCKLAFFDTDAEFRVLEQELFAEWPAAGIERDEAAIAALAPLVFPGNGARDRPLKLLLRGSAFQLKVWEALLAVPPGEIRSYQEMAAGLGRPTATRAVASAVARNTIGYLIPCHRVIRSGGEFSHYRWGDTRKKAMIAWEAGAAGDAADGG